MTLQFYSFAKTLFKVPVNEMNKFMPFSRGKKQMYVKATCVCKEPDQNWE